MSNRNFINITGIFLIIWLIFWVWILYYYAPFEIGIIEKTHWNYIIQLISTLFFWGIFLLFLKSQWWFFLSKEGQKSVETYPVFMVVFYSWGYCLIISVIIYYFFIDSQHSIDYAIVSLIISIPYSTYNLIKFYTWGKKV